MQRLIKDASQLDKVQKELGVTVDANDMSFANIANAISVVQRNMGIMGTTTKEASGTIQGATGSMKSAWQNLLTGFADENANFTQLTKDFIGTLITEDGKGGVLGTMIPRISKVIGGMSEALTTTLPMLIQSIAPVIQAQLPTLITAVKNGLSTILGVLVTGITEGIPKLVEYVPVLVQAISGGIENNLTKIIQTATKIIVTLINGLTKALPQLVAMIPTIIKTIVTTLIKNAPQILQCGKDILTSLINGIGSMLGLLREKIVNVGKTIVNAFKSILSSAVSIGKNLVEGIWSGISSGYEWIKSKIRGWVGNVTSFIKGLFGISSPSKLFRDEIGKNLALGVGVGFTDQMKSVSKTMGDAIPTSFGTAKPTARYNNGVTGTDMVKQFEEALSRVKIVLDDEVAGKFVERTVTRVIYA